MKTLSFRPSIVLVIALVVSVLAPSLAAQGYEIVAIEYSIDGISRQWALADNVDITIGQRFDDRDVLVATLEDQQQVLLNQRVLHEATVTFDESVDNPETDATEIVVFIKTRDTWNYFLLPYAKYDSNTGLLLSLRGRDYNFFGTLQELEIDFDYERTENNDNRYGISTEFSIPLQIFSQRYRLSMDQEFSIEGDETTYSLDIGPGVEFGWLGTTWAATYTQSYRYDSADEDDESFLRSRIDLETSVPTGIAVPPFGSVDYRPDVYASVNYSPDGISEARDGVTVGFDHSLDAGRVNWVGNHRDGSEASIGNGNAYNLVDEEWENVVEASASGFLGWNRLGLSSRLSGFYYLTGVDQDQDDAAEAIRGILNDQMNGDLGAFLNLDAIISFWTLKPLFEAQAGLFFDTAYVRDTRGDFYADESFVAERDLRFGTGFQIIGFPLFARSLYVRASYGVDLRAVLDGESPTDSDVRDIFIGLGHHY